MLEVKPVPVPVVSSAARAEVSFNFLFCDFFDILIDRHFFGILVLCSFFLLHHFFANLISSFTPFVPSFFSISLMSFWSSSVRVIKIKSSELFLQHGGEDKQAEQGIESQETPEEDVKKEKKEEELEEGTRKENFTKNPARQKYITPPTLSFVWILFGLLHREPK